MKLNNVILALWATLIVATPVPQGEAGELVARKEHHHNGGNGDGLNGGDSKPAPNNNDPPKTKAPKTKAHKTKKPKEHKTKTHEAAAPPAAHPTKSHHGGGGHHKSGDHKDGGHKDGGHKGGAPAKAGSPPKGGDHGDGSKGDGGKGGGDKGKGGKGKGDKGKGDKGKGKGDKGKGKDDKPKTHKTKPHKTHEHKTKTKKPHTTKHTKTKTTTTTHSTSTTTSIDRKAWPVIPIMGAHPPTMAEVKVARPAGYHGVKPTNIPITADDNAPKELQRRGKNKKNAPVDPTKCPKSAADFNDHIAACAPNECAFYSRVDKAEHDWAPKNNLALLNDKLDQAFKKENKNQYCENFWQWASEAYAGKANGEVQVLLPPLPANIAKDDKAITTWPLKNGGAAIWQSHEWPTLQRNPAVKKVFRVDVHGGQHLILER